MMLLRLKASVTLKEGRLSFREAQEKSIYFLLLFAVQVYSLSAVSDAAWAQ